MALPQRIQQQLDAADQLLAHANGQEQVPAPSADPVVEVPPVEPEVPEPVAPAPVAPPTAPEVPTVAKSQYDELVAKHRTLQGMHRGFEDTIRQLRSQVQQLNEQVNSKPAEKVETPTDPKDAEVFGADLVDMVKRVAESMFGNAARQFDARLTAIEQSLAGTTTAVAKTADDLFVDRLVAMVPDYEDINSSDAFLAWLAEVDPVYGVPRQAALDAAADVRDVSRVANVFKAFKTATQPPVVINPAPATPPAPTPAASLNRQVPPRSTASAPAVPVGKQPITSAMVDQFYRDVRMGVYRGREDEAVRIEAEINTALAEGRIQG